MDATAHEGVVLGWPKASTGATAFAVVREAGLDVHVIEDLDELVALVARGPDAIVLLDASPSLDMALDACRRIRDLPEPARLTIGLTSVPRGGHDEARAIEAGADVVWDRTVEPQVVRAYVGRATQHQRETRSDRPTATKRTTARIRQASLAERRFRALLDNVLDIVTVVDESGKIEIVNPAVRTALGHSPDVVVGTSLWDLLHADDVALARQMLDEAMTTTGVASPTTVRAWHADGSLVTLEITGQSLLEDPAIAGVLLYARDVTERIWVGAALRESEHRFSEIFENMLEGVVQIDEASRSLIQANPAFCSLVGCERHEIFGLELQDLFAAEDPEALMVILDEHFTGKRRVSDGLRTTHRDGTVRYVDIGTSRIALSGASTMIAVVRDVTVRRDTERSREMFLAVVAHELRTPVAIVRNSAEILRSRVDTMATDDRTTIVNVLSEEAERLTRLVGDALDMGAIQAGSLALRPREIALAPVVAAVAARIGLQFQTSASLRLDEIEAHVDPLRFEQVLTNLLDNAWRHCGAATKVGISLAVESTFARITIQDDGPGFPEELRGKLFARPLVPNDLPTSGIGIGLWLCRRLVESMGGAIDAAVGDEGRGTRVTFTLPLSAGGLRRKRLHADQPSVTSQGLPPPPQL